VKTATNSASSPPRCRRARALGWALALALLAIPAAAGEAGIYPSGDFVPANHLKFYLHFPERMQEGVFLKYCQLLDAQGQPVLEPFRETELWSDDHRRLTLWLHPGRQKTGVNLNEEFGPVLEPGRQYTLVVSGRWPTERGPELGQDARKVFWTTARATRQLDPSTWRLRLPCAETGGNLELSFPAPLDHALLLRCVHLLNEADLWVRGEAETGEAERVWVFRPEQGLRPGHYRVRVDSFIEDLAGNSVARPFEVDLQAAPPKPVPPTIEIKFEVKEGPLID
jgi:hypothetical protein